MNSNTSRFAFLGGLLFLLAVAFAGRVTLGTRPAPAPLPEQLTVVSPIVTTPAPTPTPTPRLPTSTPTPRPTPTIGYLSVSPRSSPEATSPPGQQSKGKIWEPTERALLIDQDAQLIYVYQNGRKIKTIPCSTGKPVLDHFTPPWTGRVGRYQGTIFSFGVYADHAWTLYKASGTILLHSAPYVYVNGKKVYQDLDALGNFPNSHGCIRVHPVDADWLTAWNIEGVPVIVMPYRGGFTE